MPIIGLVQITEPMLGFTNLPYVAGLLQAYVQHHGTPGRYLFLNPVFTREPLAKAVERLALADVVGLSLYVWNVAYSLELARRLKLRKPSITLVVGGPQVPDQAEAFLHDHPYLDLCVHGEGEATFLQVLEAFPSHDWQGIAGLSWRDGPFHHQPRGPRLKDLDTIPSPFLNGIFAPLMRAHPEKRWISVWETNRGCPFSCTFCDWGSSTRSKVQRFGEERLYREIEWFSAQRIHSLFCCDANYGALPRDVAIAEAMIAQKQRTGYPQLFYTQTAKNVTERAYDIQKKLFDAGMLTSSTLSLQSTTSAVLQAIRRENISLDTFQELQRRFLEQGLPTYTDILLGLPGESLTTFVKTVGDVISQGQHREMRIYNTYLLPNAEMAQPEYRRRYGIQSVIAPYLTPFSPLQPPPEGIQEMQEMVIGTETLPRTDWCRARAFAWLTQILYYGQALKLALLCLHRLTPIPIGDLLLALLEHPLSGDAQVLPQLRYFLVQRAEELSQGEPEYCPDIDPHTGQPAWLPTEYFASAHLLQSPRLNDFYQEVEGLLADYLATKGVILPQLALTEMLMVSCALYRAQLPGEPAFSAALTYPWDRLYTQALRGEALQLPAPGICPCMLQAGELQAVGVAS